MNKTEKLTSLTAFLLVLSFGIASAGDKPKFMPAEEAGWKLVFSDNFERDEIGENWTQVDGSWVIDDNQLSGSGIIVSTIGFPDRHLLGFQRLEMEVTSNVKPFLIVPGRAPPQVLVSDVGPLIHTRDRSQFDGPALRSGYFFQFGGFDNTRNRMLKDGTLLVEDLDPEILIVQDKKHHVVAENDEGNLRLWVDGQLVMEADEDTSIIGKGYDHFGVYIRTAALIDNIKLYVKTLPDDLDLD